MGVTTGEWIGNYLKEQGNENPKIVMIWRPIASEISEDRGNGVLAGIDSVEGVTAEVIYEAYGDFQRELAYAETERLLIAYPQVEAIVAMNSVMGLGTMSALEGRSKLEDVLVTGMGSSRTSSRWSPGARSASPSSVIRGAWAPTRRMR